MPQPLFVVAIALAMQVTIVLLLLSTYLETRSGYVAWWTGGAAMLASGAGAALWLLASPDIVPLTTIRNALVLAGAGFVLTGTASRDPRARGIVQAGLLGFGGLVFAAVVLLSQRAGMLTAHLVTGVAGGVAFLFAAEAYRRTEQVLDDLATRTIFVGLLAIGASLLAWAGIARTPAGIAAAELTGGLAMMLFGAGIEFRALARAQRLVTLSQISATLTRATRVEDMLREVLAQAGTLLQIHIGWVFLRNPRTGVDEPAAAYHLPAALEVNDCAALRGSCRCLDLLRANELTQPVNIVSCQRLERIRIQAQHASVPLRTTTGIVGLMNLVLPSGRLFSQRDLALLSTVGGQLGLAIEKLRLLDELQDKERLRSDLIKKLLTAYEDERRRVARELHDQTGQALTALILDIEMLRALVEEGRPTSLPELDRFKALAGTALEEVRKMIYDLRPTILDDLGLAAALRWYIRHQVEPRGLVVDVAIDLGEKRLDPTVETAAFRIAQEALWNVVKHASATRVKVSLAFADDRVRLRIKDDGRGFEDRRGSGDPWSGGAGLGGMEERASLLGGTVRISSALGAGTEVVAELPLPAPAKPASQS